MNIYIRLTNMFNEGRLRTVLSSGQAVVFHHLAIMSKDGDWILREDEEACTHVLSVLSSFGARYRFGAPLDCRWLAGGWSSHFEFSWKGLRIRTDFVSRPPRISAQDLADMWQEQEQRDFPVVDIRRLADLKMTNREKDYAVIGELARRMTGVRHQLLYSRSARDILQLGREHSVMAQELSALRPLLAGISQGIEHLEVQLDAERRLLIKKNERRLAGYLEAAAGWQEIWRRESASWTDADLRKSHEKMVRYATGVLPQHPLEDHHD
jgi:hypothetical protein